MFLFYSYTITKKDGSCLSEKERIQLLDYFIKYIDNMTLMLYYKEMTYFITDCKKDFSSKQLKIEIKNL